MLLSRSGERSKTYRYSAFGKELNSESSDHNPWRFASKRFDPETGFVYFGRRYYDPEIARWTSPDPAEFVDGANFHAYLRNNPLYRLDAYGLWGESFWEGGFSYGSDFFHGAYGFGESCCDIAGTMGQWLHADMEYEYGDDPSAFHSKMQSSWDDWGELTNHVKANPEIIGNVLAPACMSAYNLDENASFSDRFFAYSGATLEIGLAASFAYKSVSAIRGFKNASAAVNALNKGAAVSRGAESSIARELLNRKLVSQEIAGGHAFTKHAAEFGFTNRSQMASHIENVLSNPTHSRQLLRGRTAYWHERSGSVVVRTPAAIDGGTTFIPDTGIHYFFEVLR